MLLIDCYNLLHTDMPVSLAGLDEAALCQHLSSTRFRRQKAVLICDGVVKPGGLPKSPVPNVTLRYSGKQMSADEVIVQLVNLSSGPRGITVVTNDREIQQTVRRRKAKVLSCENFINELSREVQIQSQRQSSHGGTHAGSGKQASQSTLDWAKEFNIDLEDDLTEFLAELDIPDQQQSSTDQAPSKPVTPASRHEDKKIKSTGRKPDDLDMLYSDDDMAAIEDELKNLPGYDDLS